MREFADVIREPGLNKFLDSPLGTLYMILDEHSVPVLMIRHFDGDLPPGLVRPFSEIVLSARQWIQRNNLSDLVEIEQLSEIGLDFVARRFHIYFGSLMAYEDPDDPTEPPDELEQMRSGLRAALNETDDPKDAVVENILARSLLEPTYKSYFDDSKRKFVIVEPKMTLEDVERWVQLSDESAS